MFFLFLRTCPAHDASCVRSTACVPACVLCRSPMADLEKAVKMLQGAQQSLHLLARSPVSFIIIIISVFVCVCVCVWCVSYILHYIYRCIPMLALRLSPSPSLGSPPDHVARFCGGGAFSLHSHHQPPAAACAPCARMLTLSLSGYSGFF